MKAKWMALVMAAAFTVSSVGISWAASVTCTVKNVDGAVVTLDCGGKADQLSVGSKVKVKADKKKAIEGC